MFCGKCGAKIDGNPKFCPQCGAPLKAGDSQPARTSGQSKTASTPKPKKKFIFARQLASANQRMADTAHALIYLPNLTISILWIFDSIGISKLIGDYESTSLLELFGGGMVVVTFLFGWLGTIASSCMLGKHMLKQDKKVSAPILPGLFLIWSVVCYVFAVARVNDIITQSGKLSQASVTVAPNAVGWLYIMCCVALFGLRTLSMTEN